MRKIALVFLAFLMCVSLCACNESHTPPASSTPSTNTGSTVSVPAECSHSWQSATCTVPQTCKNCGETNGEANGHDWKAATCATPKTCTVCSETSGSANDHDWEAATCTTPKTCTVCSETSGSANGHDWKAATCTTPKTCTVCQDKEGEKLECEKGSNGSCIRCGKCMLALEEVLSAPLDSLNEINRFVPYYYAKHCYSGGNFRFIFNSANGVCLSWGAKNYTDKEIKYVTFTINYFNRVGDPAYSSTSGKNYSQHRITGPVGAHESFYIRLLIDYGSDIYYGVMSQVTIEYMDGSIVTGNYGYTTWHNIRSTGSPNECFITG